MTVRIEKPSLNLREELAKGTDNTLDKAVWGDLTVNGSVTADDTYVGREGGYDGTAGIHLQNDGFIGASRDSFHVATLNRNTSDGDIAIFRKNNATVGSIGTESNAFTIDGGGGYAGLYIGINSVLARNSGALADGSKDIGNASYRWKDLYLSGGVYLGGTGAANHLDDYEEGTWTVSFYDALAGGNASPTTVTGSYVKVGMIVTARFSISNISTSGMTAGNRFYIRGLPFSSRVNSVASADLRNVTFNGNPVAVLDGSQTVLFFQDSQSGTTFDDLLVSDFPTGANSITLQITYETA